MCSSNYLHYKTGGIKPNNMAETCNVESKNVALLQGLCTTFFGLRFTFSLAKNLPKYTACFCLPKAHYSTHFRVEKKTATVQSWKWLARHNFHPKEAKHSNWSPSRIMGSGGVCSWATYVKYSKANFDWHQSKYELVFTGFGHCYSLLY